jgi:transcriptional regulator with XRE-family HTH domain
MARRNADPDTRRRFSTWLKQARVDAGYDTQSAFANELDIHLRLLQKWEGAEGLPDAQNYQRLLATLGVASGPLDEYRTVSQRPSIADRVALLEAEVSALRAELRGDAPRDEHDPGDARAAVANVAARKPRQRRESNGRSRPRSTGPLE